MVKIKKEKMRDGQIVQIVRDVRVQSKAIERIAEEQAIPHAGVEEGFDAEVVPRAEKATASAIPNREGEIT